MNVRGMWTFADGMFTVLEGWFGVKEESASGLVLPERKPIIAVLEQEWEEAGYEGI